MAGADCIFHVSFSFHARGRQRLKEMTHPSETLGPTPQMPTPGNTPVCSSPAWTVSLTSSVGGRRCSAGFQPQLGVSGQVKRSKVGISSLLIETLHVPPPSGPQREQEVPPHTAPFPQLLCVTEVQLTNEGISSVLSRNTFVISSQERSSSYVLEFKF